MESEKENDISMKAPPFSLVKVYRTMRKKGVLGALEDPEQGPHVHLTLLIATIVVVSVGIVLITQFVI
ncbi:MAG: hypothetical protein R6V01_01610 [Thermoplasmatota archaeon]